MAQLPSNPSATTAPRRKVLGRITNVLLYALCISSWSTGADSPKTWPSPNETGQCPPGCLHVNVIDLHLQGTASPAGPPLHIQLLPGKNPKLSNTSEPASRVEDVRSLHWQEGSIIYALTWFFLNPDDERHAPSPPCRVLMIQLTGENTGSEYANASATLTILQNEKELPLQLDRELLTAPAGDQRISLGAVRVASEGIERTSHPTRLAFHGHMPPGTSGAMSVRIPTSRLDQRTDLEWLMDLEFDDELRRLQRAQRRTARTEQSH